jgi:pimeloyl-ACP methyl ester carboxylesterase
LPSKLVQGVTFAWAGVVRSKLEVSMRKVIFLPGMDGTGDLLVPLAQACASLNPEIIAYPKNVSLGYAQLTELVGSKLGPSNVIVAESFSGPILSRLITDFPQQIDRAIFIASFLGQAIGQDVQVPRSTRRTGAAKGVLRFFSPMSRFVTAMPLPRWVIRNFLADRHTPEEMIQRIHENILSVAPGVMAHRMAASLSEPMPRYQSSIPCMYVRPQHDRLIHRRHLAHFAKCFEDFHVCELEGPHLIAQSRPKEVAKLVCDFATQD